MKSQLSFHSISKAFGGTQALREVSMEIEGGEIVALLGENGAGKSTLIKILGGIYQSDQGQVLVNQQPYRHKTGNLNTKQEVAFIHQDLGLIEWMSIAENMAMAQGYPKHFLGRICWKSCQSFATQALQRIGVEFDPTARIQSLTRAEKSMVAIARAIAVQCHFLVLDEPSASLPETDVQLLFEILKQLKKDGVGMIYVSHRLDEIFQIADRVVVLRDGQVAGERKINQTHAKELIHLIVGHEPKVFDKSETSKASVPVLEVKNLCSHNAGPVSFNINLGEIVGLVGLRGAGQEVIGRCLFGDLEFEGEVYLSGQNFQPHSPREAMKYGVALIAGDRVVESNLTHLTIRENIFVNLKALGHPLYSWRSLKKEKEEAHQVGKTVGVQPNSSELPIEFLSGGNQQKVIVGRWLQTKSRVLIAEDPTAGVDVGAKTEIYELFNQITQQGVTVIIISTDFEEISTICHRAIVLSDGKIATELSGNALNTKSLIQASCILR